MVDCEIKRLGIFVFYDKDNIVDDYVIHLLDDFVKNVSSLVIISNSKLNEENKNKLLKYSTNIIERDNVGFDAGALAEYFNNNNEYLQYDEVVYSNDTFFGFFTPLSDIFNKMQNKDCDFWGLTISHKQPDSWHIFDGTYTPEHIQTFFMVFKNNVLNSDAFKSYWKKYNANKINNFYDVVTKHEILFTKYLKDNGFKYASYVEDSYVDDDYNRNYNIYENDSQTQIVIDKAPFMKRKNLSFKFEDMLYLNDDFDNKWVLDYIKNNTNYDVSLIWKNVLRIYNLNKIKQITSLREIISEKNHTEYTELSYFIILENMKFVDYIIEKMCCEKSVIIYTSKKDIFEKLKDKLNVRLITDDFKNELSNYINKIDSQYCVMLNFTDDNSKVSLVDTSRNKVIIENLIQSKDYIQEVIDLLKDENTSMAYSPENLNNEDFYNNLFWNDQEYEVVKELVPEYKVISKEEVPFSFSENFIIKTEILKSIDLSKINISDYKKIISALSIALAYVGCTKYKHPIEVMSCKYANYRIRALENIYKKTYTKIYNNNKEYPHTFSGSMDGMKTQNKKLSKLIIGTIRGKNSKVELKNYLWKSNAYRKFTQSHIWKASKFIVKGRKK